MCNWGSANLTLRDCGLYDNNRSQYNGIGNTGDAKASIQINDASTYLANTFYWNPNLRFLMEVLDTQVHYTGLGSSSQKIGFFIGEELGDIPNDNKNIIKIDDVGFIGQDYAIDLSEVDLTNLRVSLGDNSYQQIGIKTVNEPLNGNYFELPFSNHSMNLNEADFSVTNTGNIEITEGVGGARLNPYNVNELRAEPYGSDIQVILKDSNKIQFIVPVSGCSIDGSMVNSVLSQALVQLNDLFTNTTGFASGGNPVTGFALAGDNLTLTLQDGTSYTVDVTTLGVDENKFVSSGALNGSNLELTMNDSSIITIDATNMVNGSSLPAIANNWYVAYGSTSSTEITTPRLTNAIKNVMPIYNGEALEQGQEYIWNHDDTGTLHIGTWAGSTTNATGTNSGLDVHWGIKFKIEGSSVGGGRNIVCPVTDSSVASHSVGVDIDSNFSSGYGITNSTVFAIRYSEDNFLYLYDISNGTDVFICKSLLSLDGNPIFLHIAGQTTSVQTKIPVLTERFIDWTIVHDFDNSETSIKDGIEDHTVIRTNITISQGEKLMMNLVADGRSNYFGTNYTGASSGNSLAETSLENRWIYGTSEQIFSGNDWTNNTNAQYWDASLGGSGAWQVANGVNAGMVSWRYQTNNTLELWSEDVGELIMTCDVPMDGNPIHIFYGVRENTVFNHFPTVSKQQIGQGSQPITTFAPDISNQSFNITEGAAFNVQIALDANSDIVNQYVEEDVPSWAVLNQSTGVFNGTAPAYNGSTDSHVINCKAANAVGGSTSFQITINVQEITYTNTKSLFFEDGVSSYLGGNAALITSMERVDSTDYSEVTLSNLYPSSFNTTYIRQSTGFVLDTGTVSSGNALFHADSNYYYYVQKTGFDAEDRIIIWSVEDNKWMAVYNFNDPDYTEGNITDNQALGSSGVYDADIVGTSITADGRNVPFANSDIVYSTSTGYGSQHAWSLSLWVKGSTSNSGQTIFYFGNNDVVNNGHIELRQTNHNGAKRLRLRYGSNGNHLQFTTPSGSITPSSWQHVLVTYNGGETGVASGSMSTYYGAFKIYIDGVLQTTSNTHSNYGYNGSVVGQNYRFGRFASGTYPKDMTYNQIAIWDSDQSANISDIYNGGATQDLSLLTDQPEHYYEIEDSTTTIQDLISSAHLVGYNFTSSDLVTDTP